MVSSKYELSNFGCLRGCMWAVCLWVSAVIESLVQKSVFRVRLESLFATREDQCLLNNEKSLLCSLLDCANISIWGAKRRGWLVSRAKRRGRLVERERRKAASLVSSSSIPVRSCLNSLPWVGVCVPTSQWVCLCLLTK